MCGAICGSTNREKPQNKDPKREFENALANVSKDILRLEHQIAKIDDQLDVWENMEKKPTADINTAMRKRIGLQEILDEQRIEREGLNRKLKDLKTLETTKKSSAMEAIGIDIKKKLIDHNEDIIEKLKIKEELQAELAEHQDTKKELRSNDVELKKEEEKMEEVEDY